MTKQITMNANANYSRLIIDIHMAQLTLVRRIVANPRTLLNIIRNLNTIAFI